MELFYRQKKSGWECYDREGKVATGATKELAKRMYYTLYGIKMQECGYNMDKFKFGQK